MCPKMLSPSQAASKISHRHFSKGFSTQIRKHFHREALRADIHEPNARSSMVPRGFKQTLYSLVAFQLSAGGRGCLGEGRLGVPGKVWEFRFLPPFPSVPRENRSSRNVWENAWKCQTSFFQTSVVGESEQSLKGKEVGNMRGKGWKERALKAYMKNSEFGLGTLRHLSKGRP